MTEIPKKTVFLDSVYHKNIPSEVEDTLRLGADHWANLCGPYLPHPVMSTHAYSQTAVHSCRWVFPMQRKPSTVKSAPCSLHTIKTKALWKWCFEILHQIQIAFSLPHRSLSFYYLCVWEFNISHMWPPPHETWCFSLQDPLSSTAASVWIECLTGAECDPVTPLIAFSRPALETAKFFYFCLQVIR